MATLTIHNNVFDGSAEDCADVTKHFDTVDDAYSYAHNVLALECSEFTVSKHNPVCWEYWDRGLDCPCIPDEVDRAMRAGARPEDVM